jgi:hypothetical protein
LNLNLFKINNIKNNTSKLNNHSNTKFANDLKNNLRKRQDNNLPDNFHNINISRNKKILSNGYNNNEFLTNLPIDNSNLRNKNSSSNFKSQNCSQRIKIKGKIYIFINNILLYIILLYIIKPFIT